MSDIDDKGPWKAGDSHIASDDFEHDVMLHVNGCFASSEQKRDYCAMIAAKLNGYADLQARLAECERENDSLRFLYEGNAGMGAKAVELQLENDTLRARLAECERACDKCMKDSADAIKFVAGANKVVNDTLRAQLTETQRLLEVQLAVGDKLEAEVKRLKESELQAYKASAIHSRKAKKAEAELAALREAVSEVADGDCYYSDECTPETMRVYRHGKCNICTLRDALGR